MREEAEFLEPLIIESNRLLDDIFVDVVILLGQVKKTQVSRPDFYKKGERAGSSFVIYYLLLHAFFTHYYLPPGIRWRS